jgi:hypothetical protein
MHTSSQDGDTHSFAHVTLAGRLVVIGGSSEHTVMPREREPGLRWPIRLSAGCRHWAQQRRTVQRRQ